jgi:DNA-binding NarL/FixJ family response regulator
VAATRILIVDDHEVVREGLLRILEQCEDMEVVGWASNGEQAAELTEQLRPTVVLLDLSLPGMHGLDVLPLLLRLNPAPRIVVLTMHDDEDLVLGAVRGGAHGFVLKHSSGVELVTAIRRVASGGRYFDEVVVQALMQSEGRVKEEPLSSREAEILQLVAGGHTNKEIGLQLFISVDTVKAHLESIFRKLGVSDRTEAVAVAFRIGLLH